MGKQIIEFRIQIVVEPDDVGFHAYCPALKGLHTSGATEKEALENAKFAAKVYLESSISHGDPIPVGIIAGQAGQETRATEPPPTHHTEDLSIACGVI